MEKNNEAIEKKIKEKSEIAKEVNPPAKKIFSLNPKSNKPVSSVQPKHKPRVTFHFGTGPKFPAFRDPNEPFKVSF